MILQYAGIFLNLADLLRQLEILGKAPYLPIHLSKEEQERWKERCLTVLEINIGMCGLLNLRMSKLYIEEFVKDWKARGLPYLVSEGRVVELKRLLQSELEQATFFHVSELKADYYNARRLFGSEVAEHFPSAQFDIREAGNCYALGRNTACVFHLMRVLETGLTVLGAVFGVSLAHTNWAPAIEQIESKIRDMHKDPVWKALPDCKEEQEFYAQAASHFGVLKDAWRNYTAHVRGQYDEQEASDVFTTVRAFMQKLATRLHE
jgi:hypothetical protein